MFIILQIPGKQFFLQKKEKILVSKLNDFDTRITCDPQESHVIHTESHVIHKEVLMELKKKYLPEVRKLFRNFSRRHFLHSHGYQGWSLLFAS